MIDKLEGLALRSVALRDPEYFYRRICRYYSQNFHTPLLEVYELPWAFVFTNYLEHIMENNNTKEYIYDLSIEMFYPELVESEEEELQDWIKKIEEEEEAKRQAKAKKEKQGEENPHIEEPENPHTEQEEPENPHIDEEEINMGSTSFEHLEDEIIEDDDDEQ